MSGLKYFWLCLWFLPQLSLAQNLPDFQKIKLSKPIHYQEAEPLVLKTSAFILSRDMNSDKVNRRKAGQFLMRWMSGTPHHVFYLEPQDICYFENHTEYLLGFMAALSQYSIHQPKESRMEKFKGALEITLPYILQFGNRKDWSRALEDLMKAFQNNSLPEYLDEHYVQ